MSRPTSRTLRRAAIAGGVLAGLAVPSAAMAADPSSQAVVLTTDNKISTFETAHPEEATAPVAVTGLADSDKLVGIDFRPQNGYLYGLGRKVSDGSLQVYAISARTGVAGAVGARIPTIGGTAEGTQFGFDFNPVADKIRVVSSAGLNARLNPNTGALINKDDNITGGTVDGAAYTSNKQNATATTLYTLSGAENKLYRQSPPDSGTQTGELGVTLAGSPADFDAVGGFDIAQGVDTAANAEAAAGAVGYAAVKANGQQVLAGIELKTGNVVGFAPIANVSGGVQGLAIQNEATVGSLPSVALVGTKIQRFDVTAPKTDAPLSADISGLPDGEVPAAIDYRPQTGQLLLLGIDAAQDEGSLYAVDPQTGAASRIGTAGSVAFKAAGTPGGGAVTDLPPVTDGTYDIDINPAVDRVRVVTSTGLNFRLNPTVASDAGVAADANAPGTTTPDPADGINPDGGQNGADTTGFVGGTAYTNAFGQTIPTTPAGKTTQYGISAAKDTLQIQTPPNSGTQTAPLPLKVGSAPLDVTAVEGFDVLSSATSSEPNVAATGAGVAALKSAGASALYAIDLATGAAGKIGDLSADTRSIAIGAGPAPLKVRTVTPPPAGGGGGGGTNPPATNPPATTPPVVTPPKKAGFASSTKLTVKLRATRISANGPAKVTFRNTNRFAVKVRIQATTPKSGKRKAIKYSTKTYTVKASSSRTINVRLPAAARKVLRTKRKLTIKVTLRVTAPDGKNRTVRKTLTARRK